MAAGNAVIGALRVNLGLDSAQFEAGLKKAQSSLSGFGKSAAVAGAAAATALVAAGTAMAVAIKGVIDSADELSKTAQKVGVTVESLSRLQYAGSLADVSLEQLATGLKKLSANMAEAASTGKGKAAEAFRALGISVTDAAGNLKAGDVILSEVAGKFATLQDGAGKTALAMAIFGKSGADLIPLLNSGSDGLAEMAAEAEKLGLVVDTKTAKSAEAFNDNITRLKAVLSGMTTQVAAALLPALESLSNAMVAAAQNGDFLRAVGATLGGVLKVLGTAAVVVGGAFAELAYILASTVNATLRALVGDFAGAQRELQWGGRGMADTFKGSAKAIEAIWTTTGERVKATAGPVSEQIAAPIMRAAERTKGAAKDIETEAQKAAKAIRAYLADEQKAFANDNASPELVKFRERLAKASEALKLGLTGEADALIDLATRASVSTDELQQLAAAQVEVVKTIPKVDILRDKWGEFRAEIEDATRKFYDVQYAVEDLFYGIRNNDWVGAFGGLLRAIDQIKAAFDTAATSGQRMAALVGAASAVGGAIGGKAGGALSGAASGALLGAKLGSSVPGVGNVIGAGIGAVLGGLGGLFGASKAKKRAKKEAAARAKAEAEQRAADLAAASRALDIELLRAQGKAQEALNAQREDELAKADPTLRERMKALYALQDQAEAEAKLAEARQQQRDIAREILRLTDADAAAEAERADILAALPESLRGLQSAAWALADAQDALSEAERARDEAVTAAQDRITDARQALSDAYEREADGLRQVRDRFADLAATLADFGKELEGIAKGNPAQALAARRAEFERVSALAATGNEQALADLPEVSRAFLEASRAAAPDARAYGRDLAAVRRAVADGQKAAQAQVSNAEQQLTALQASVQWLIAINETELSVKQALDSLAEAVLQAAAEQRAAMEAVSRAAQAAADAAAAAKAANDNAVKVPGFDVAAASTALTSTATTAAVDAMAAEGNAPLVSAIDQALGPYLYSIVKATSLTADLTQLARDEADAA
jgi:hypothetical protein